MWCDLSTIYKHETIRLVEADFCALGRHRLCLKCAYWGTLLMEIDVPFVVSAPLVCENVSIAKFKPNIKTIQGLYSTINHYSSKPDCIQPLIRWQYPGAMRNFQSLLEGLRVISGVANDFAEFINSVEFNRSVKTLSQWLCFETTR